MRGERMHVTKHTTAVDTHYLLNRGRICFHMDAWRKVVRKGLMEKNKNRLNPVVAILVGLCYLADPISS